jgi:hypothetical protein
MPAFRVDLGRPRGRFVRDAAALQWRLVQPDPDPAMRRPAPCPVPVALLCAAFALGMADVAAAQGLPARKPGLWEITMQVTNAPSQTMRQCVDARTDAQMQRFGKGLGREQCTRESMRRDGDRYLGESECTVGASTMTSRSVFAGNFAKAYRGEVESRYVPPIAGVSQSKLTVNARWIGACPAGWQPGDIQVPNMGRVNVSELMAPRAQRP